MSAELLKQWRAGLELPQEGWETPGVILFDEDEDEEEADEAFGDDALEEEDEDFIEDDEDFLEEEEAEVEDEEEFDDEDEEL